MKLAIKETFKDVGNLYNNFVHWNISKTLYYLYGIGLGVIGVIPFILIFLLTGGVFKEFLGSLLYSVYLLNPLGNVLLILSFFAFSVFYCFSFLLFLRLNNSYLHDSKIPYFKNDFLNFKLFGRYILLTLIILLISFVIPLIVALLVFFLIITISGGVQAAILLSMSPTINLFVASTLILILLFSISVFYLFYRFVFSYLILVEDEKNDKTIISILKSSFKKTKPLKKFGKFLLVYLLLGLLYLPFFIISSSTKDTSEDLKDYSQYIKLDDSQKEEIKKKVGSYYYDELEAEYSGKKESDIKKLQEFYGLVNIFISLLRFLCVNGVFLMALNSIYKRIINKD